MLRTALRAAGVAEVASYADLSVSGLGTLEPDLLVCDLDRLDVDRLEFLRRVRFVLPECLIAVYTADLHRIWSRACHLAGANCLLAKASSENDVAMGVRQTLRSGCFTDRRFVT